MLNKLGNKRSKAAAFIAVAVGATSFIGLMPAKAADPVVLDFWSRAAQVDFIKSVGDEFNKINPNIQVKVTTIPDAEFVQKLSTASVSGSAPDITSVDLILVPYFAKNGVFDDLTSYTKGLSFKKELSPAHMALGKYGNKQFALPFTAEASVLFWNKDLFKKAGLNPEVAPKTWADIEKAAKAITALGGDTKGYYFSGACGGCNIFTFAPMMWASGGSVLTDKGRPTFTNSQVGKALAFYNNLWEKGYIPKSAKTDNGASFAAPFASGKVGMVGAGAFFISGLRDNNPEINYGVAPLPGEKAGQSGSFAGGDNIAILKGTKHPKESRVFMDWALNAGQKFIAKKAVVPIRSDIANSDYVPQDPRFKVIADMMKIGKTPYSVAYTPLIADGQGPWVKVLGSIFDGKIKEAQRAAQKQALEIVKKQG
jgi:multiple sugar transport system substrate-binding protein